MLKIKITLMFFVVLAFINNAYSCTKVTSCTTAGSCLTVNYTTDYNFCNASSDACGESRFTNNFYFTSTCGTHTQYSWCNPSTTPPAMSSALDLTQWVSYSTGICKFTDGGTNNIFVSNVVSGKDQISCNVTLNQGGRSASCNI